MLACYWLHLRAPDHSVEADHGLQQKADSEKSPWMVLLMVSWILPFVTPVPAPRDYGQLHRLLTDPNLLLTPRVRTRVTRRKQRTVGRVRTCATIIPRHIRIPHGWQAGTFVRAMRVRRDNTNIQVSSTVACGVSHH